MYVLNLFFSFQLEPFSSLTPYYAQQNALLITTPEDSMTLVTTSPGDKTEWVRAIQNTIKTKLNKPQAPAARTATYTFTKHATYKDATYTGILSNNSDGLECLLLPTTTFQELYLCSVFF